MESPLRAIRISYSGSLAVARGLPQEEIHLGSVTTAAALYRLLDHHHQLRLPPEQLQVVINGEAGDLDSLVGPGDHLHLLPPQA